MVAVCKNTFDANYACFFAMGANVNSARHRKKATVVRLKGIFAHC